MYFEMVGKCDVEHTHEHCVDQHVVVVEDHVANRECQSQASRAASRSSSRTMVATRAPSSRRNMAEEGDQWALIFA